MLTRLIGNLLLTLFLSNFLYAGQEMELTGPYQRNIQIVVDRGYEEERKKEAEDNQPIILRTVEDAQNYVKALMRNPRQVTEFEVADNVQLTPQLLCSYIIQETDIEMDLEEGEIFTKAVKRDFPSEYRNLSHWLVEIHYLQQQEERENELKKKEQLQRRRNLKREEFESRLKNFVIKKIEKRLDKFSKHYTKTAACFGFFVIGSTATLLIMIMGNLYCVL